MWKEKFFEMYFNNSLEFKTIELKKIKYVFFIDIIKQNI